MEEFRRDLAAVTPETIGHKLDTYAFELNLLMRLASAWGLTVFVDTVDREGHTEVMVRLSSDPGRNRLPGEDAP